MILRPLLLLPGLFLSISCLVPRSVLAEERGSEVARQAARDGIAAYNGGDYDAAKRRLLEAERGLDYLEVPEQVTVHKYLAYTWAAFDDGVKAEQEFRQALALEPDLTLPSGLSPKILAAFEQTRKDIAREKAVASGTPVPTFTSPPLPPSAQPQSAGAGIALAGALPVAGSFHGATSLYSAELLTSWEMQQTAIELGLGYRATSNQPVSVAQTMLDIGVDYYVTPRLEWAPFGSAGISLSTVTSSWGTPDPTTNRRPSDTVTGLGGWAGVGLTMFRGPGVHLIGIARYRVDFPGGGGAVSHGPLFGVILTISRRPSSCCF